MTNSLGAEEEFQCLCCMQDVLALAKHLISSSARSLTHLQLRDIGCPACLQALDAASPTASTPAWLQQNLPDADDQHATSGGSATASEVGAMHTFHQLTRLQTLHIAAAETRTWCSAVQCISQMTSLMHLTLQSVRSLVLGSGCPITRLTGLSALYLGGSTEGAAADSSILDADVYALLHMPSLRQLCVFSGKMAGNFAALRRHTPYAADSNRHAKDYRARRAAAHMPSDMCPQPPSSIEELHLHGYASMCFGAAYQSIAQLCPELRNLHLEASRPFSAVPADLQHLAEMPRLQCAVLKNALQRPPSARTVAALCAAPSLRFLSLPGCGPGVAEALHPAARWLQARGGELQVDVWGQAPVHADQYVLHTNASEELPDGGLPQRLLPREAEAALPAVQQLQEAARAAGMRVTPRERRAPVPVMQYSKQALLGLRGQTAMLARGGMSDVPSELLHAAW